ncbi:hypothetical protein K144316041_p10700 (plasmid) [Clostridium tetani]|uniref:Uncharacterized protein n=1 Tax=Clostridium tetani TaxID=1513 RepID=A0ABC8EFP7_CLOTA|nr:hypothetical protein [Clostridium tetani]BDR68567.1 hypothetical protein K144312032_p10570 [Clostridium tetani]BDR74142.1 hypothetical protein K144316041_p10700 [Clostridium tetani]BDR82498.1 hypothetical protein K234311028_p10570 [Clostridium tetani]BDR90888.1 hypothetical protein N072000002_p10570 [Clostridium tetani]
MLQVKPIENKEIKEDEYIYNTNVLTNVEAKEKLINIIDNYDNIEKMLKCFENQLDQWAYKTSGYGNEFMDNDF